MVCSISADRTAVANAPSCAMRVVRRMAVVSFLLVAACAGVAPASGAGGPIGAGGGDPSRWTSCRDAEAVSAYEQAMVAVQAGRYAAALPLLLRTLQRCPDHVRAHLHYQDGALQVGGEAEAAMRRFYAELPERPDSPVPTYVKARLEPSSWSQKSMLESIVQREPSFYWAHLSLGRVLRANGRLSEAAAAFRQVLAYEPGLGEAHLELAETLVDLGKDTLAAEHYRYYLRGAPVDRAVTQEYVRLLVYRLGRAEEAEPWIERLLQRDPGDESVRMDRAAAWWRKGQPEAALRAYLDVLRDRPDEARAVLNVGFLYYDVLAGQDPELQRRYWPKARAAFLLFQQMVRPEDGQDYLEYLLAVPYRLRRIEEVLGPAAAAAMAPTIQDLAF